MKTLYLAMPLIAAFTLMLILGIPSWIIEAYRRTRNLFTEHTYPVEKLS